MPDQPDQKRPGTTPNYYEAVAQAVELWNEMPVAVLDQQLAHDYALLQTMGKYITNGSKRASLTLAKTPRTS